MANGPYPSVGIYWYEDFDPTIAPGVPAPFKQLLIRTDTTPAELYYKSGLGDTDWTLIGGGGGGGGGVNVDSHSVPIGAGPYTLLNFLGAGVSAADAGGGQAAITIPGGIDGLDVDQQGVPIGAGPFTLLNFTDVAIIATDGGGGAVEIASNPPYVDLRLPPYNIVADDTSKAATNVAGINQAIADFTGTSARLVLPYGDTYVEQGSLHACVRFGTGITDLTLAGQGMYGSNLVQFCVGAFGELDLLVMDGCQRIELCDMGLFQQQITNPDPGQQNHVWCVYNNTLGGTTKDIVGHDLFFGKSIGDGIRILANDPTDKCVDIRIYDFVMLQNGVVTSTPPNGRVGARSGIALQRGGVDLWFSNFFIRGTQNSPIDEEPSAGAGLRTHFDGFIIDNSLGLTSGALTMGGTTVSSRDLRVTNGYVLAGLVGISGPTDGCQIDGLTIDTTAPMPGSPTDPNLIIRSAGSGTGSPSLQLVNVTVRRTGTSTAGPCVDIINTGTRTIIRNMTIVQGVSGVPFIVDTGTHLNIDGFQLTYDGASPAAQSGITVQAVNADVNDLRINNVDIIVSTGKLKAAITLASRVGRTMSRIQIRDIKSAGFATYGVYMTLSPGTMDLNPELSGIVNGSDIVWAQANAGDNPITSIYPIISGNRGDVCSFVGEATPEGFCTSIPGNTCVFKSANLTLVYIKRTGTGNTGWEVIEGNTLTPTALGAGTNNNYAPTNIDSASWVRQDISAAGAIITGLLIATGSLLNRRTVILTNIATNVLRTITLTNEDTNSTAANRFTLPNGVSLVIPAGGSVELTYDLTSARWRPTAIVDNTNTLALPEVWGQNDVAASQTNVVLQPLVSENFPSIRMMRSGSIVGLATQWSEAITAGSVTITITKNGAAGTLAITSTSGTGSQSTQGPGIDTYVAGDLIGVQITTNGAFAPVTTDVEAWIEVSE